MLVAPTVCLLLELAIASNCGVRYQLILGKLRSGATTLGVIPRSFIKYSGPKLITYRDDSFDQLQIFMN